MALPGYSYDLLVYTSLAADFGEPISFYGHPVTKERHIPCRTNMSMGIFEDAKCPDGAWQFLSYLLSPVIQDSFNNNSQVMSGTYPVLRSSMELMLAEQKKERTDGVMGGGTSLPGSSLVLNYESTPLSDENEQAFLEQIDKIDVLISEDYDILGVLIDESDAYFAGQKSEDTVAGIIQNRVQTLVNERID